jgi:hypothetical protein
VPAHEQLGQQGQALEPRDLAELAVHTAWAM